MKKTFWFFILFCFSVPAAYPAELPVRQVVLYKHGIGYFVRAGQLGSGESAQLDFKASEMNDVLKSLTIRESGGSGVNGLRYDSSEPIQNKLAQYPFRIERGQPVSSILDQLKGTRIELEYASETISGTLISARVIPATDQRPEIERVTLLLSTGVWRNLDLSAASSIRFLDAALQQQFREYLTALSGARSLEKKSIYIDSAGTRQRDIVASYMIPMPVWKSSYRLIWAEDTEPTLEGWAIVDNTTGEDWSGVQLSLVSGRPISFISRLYEPRYINRPLAELPEDRAQAPVLHQGAFESKEMAAEEAVQDRLERGRRAMAPASVAQQVVVSGEVPLYASDVPSRLASTAAAAELGDLFEYRFPSTVTVRKNESAMLPFLQQEITARKLVVFREQGSVHPLHSMELTNSSGKTLDGGPITVYEAGAYAGEALMETLKDGDERLISYGVDLGTRITTAFDSKAEVVREVHLRRGVLTTRSAIAETRTFTMNNVDADPKTIVIEHPARPQYNLIDMEPDEKTANAYRFEVTVDGGATVKFPVNEERILDRSVQITNITSDVIASYVSNRELSAEARTQLQRVLDFQRQIAAAANEIQRLEQQIQSIFQDQERLRQNINSLNRVSGQQQQVQSYSLRLAAQEVELAGLRDRLSAAQQRQASLQSDLNSLIESMEF